MHRKAVQELLRQYLTHYPNDQQALTIKDFILHHENCFERANEVGHMTASAWLLNPSGDQVLMTHHKKLNKWLQLGGHADGESDLKKVAWQEATEESGIKNIKFLDPFVFDADVHLIPENPKEKAHFHYDLRFVLQTEDNTAFQISAESHDLRWFTYEEIQKNIEEESILRMARKWIKFYK